MIKKSNYVNYVIINGIKVKGFYTFLTYFIYFMIFIYDKKRDFGSTKPLFYENI